MYTIAEGLEEMLLHEPGHRKNRMSIKVCDLIVDVEPSHGKEVTKVSWNKGSIKEFEAEMEGRFGSWDVEAVGKKSRIVKG